MTITATDVLSDDVLARFDERAPLYDRENRFFDEDFDRLRRSGYLLAAVPQELGRGGLALDGYSHLVRRLAYVAPAAALAVNMRCYWTGVAADLLKSRAVVVTAAHRDQQTPFATEVHGGDDVGNIHTANDQARPLVDHAVVERPHRVAIRIARRYHRPRRLCWKPAASSSVMTTMVSRSIHHRRPPPPAS
jgi:hypothetical protein